MFNNYFIFIHLFVVAVVLVVDDDVDDDDVIVCQCFTNFMLILIQLWVLYQFYFPYYKSLLMQFTEP